MGEQLAAARRFPLQIRPEGVGVERRQNQTGLAGEMFRRRLARLIGGGEMDKAVGQIDRRTGEGTALLRYIPLFLRGNLVNELHLPLQIFADLKAFAETVKDFRLLF